MRRTLIIGAAGFIGSHLVRQLAAQGDQVHALVRETTQLDRLHDLAGGLHVHRLDLADRDALDRCLAAAMPDRVFHLAAEARSLMVPDFAGARRSLANITNLVGLIEALAAMRRPPEVVVRAGTIAEYGSAPVPFRETMREEPVSPYGASMAAATQYLAMLAPALPCRIATARMALVYGDGQAGSFFIPAAIRACLAGEQVVVSRPADRRDLIHVDDAVAGLIALAHSPPPGASVLNIATGVAPTMLEVAQLIVDIMGSKAGLARGDGAAPDQPALELRADPAQARALLGWEAKTALDRGIRRTVSAMLARDTPQLRMAG